jgi:hypothetical protein
METQEQGQQARTPSSFDDYRKELWGALKVSHEQYDKAIITLSSGGLAISLTLIKDVFPVERMSSPCWLVATWFLFCGSIISTVMSFLTT